MPKNPPDGIQRITTRIAYEDPIAAVEFLGRAFGFPEIESMRIERSDGSIILTEIQIADCYIMIGPAGSHDIASPKSVGLSTESLMVYVDGIDDHFATAKANGAEIIDEPADQYWGDRRYAARDLEGHLWFFHEHTKDVSREEIDAVEASFRGGG